MNNRSNAFVSVVMPAYNVENYIAEAIESICNQTYEDFEFIIVDDGSTYSTADIIRNYAKQDRRIRPIFADHTRAPNAGNIGVCAAQGQWIARMDADDISLPHRLEIQLDWIQSNNLDICGCIVQTKGLRDDIFWYPEKQDAIRREFLFRVGLLQPTVMMKAELLKENPFNGLTYFEDYEILTRLAPRFIMGNIQEVLVYYRCHDEQSHVVLSKQFQSDFQKYRFRYFYTLYPNTPLPDYLTLARISDKQPMTNLRELQRAGQWLVEMANQPDLKLRQRMADRWKETCERSKALGDEWESVYQEFKPLIERNEMTDKSI